MIRVLHVGLSSNPGGVESFVLNYHKNINRNAVQFNYADLYGDGLAFSEDIEQLGGNIFRLPNYKKHPISSAWRFNRILKEEKSDIVHIHMQSTANLMPVLVALCHMNVTVICHSHSSSTPEGLLRKVLHAINSKIIRILSVEKWACGVRAGMWMWGDKFDNNNIIPNAVNSDSYKRNEEIRRSIRNKIGFSDKDKVIGFVGRFGDEKNTFFLIEVLKKLLKISGDYKLLTVGGNGLYDQFRQKIKDDGLEKNCYSAGVQRSANDWYQAMDAFLLPSFFEGFPMVGVEAQAAGLPCFMSDRISDEINISGNIKFLPIGQNASVLWAEEIDRRLMNMNINNNFPEKYNIARSADVLLHKYTDIMKMRK